MEYFDLAHGGSVVGLCKIVNGLVRPRENIMRLASQIILFS